MKALLFSGGIDSTALAWGLRPERLLFVDYGQLAAPGERRAACAIVRELGAHFDEVTIDARQIGSGAMVGGIPVSNAAPEFWPFRNQFLVTVAAMRYADVPLEAIMIGSVMGDDVHPDGTLAFREALAGLLNVQAGPELEAPGADVTTEEMISLYGVPPTLLGWTYSCHTGEWACGSCRGCHKHNQIMAAAAP